MQNSFWQRIRDSWQLTADIILVAVLSVTLLIYITHILPLTWSKDLLILFSLLGVLPVGYSALRAVINKKVTVDLLASIALIFSFLAGEWSSAAFINLMLAFARIFDGLTQMRTKRIIQNLLKFRPSKVKIKKDNQIIEIPLEKVQVGDVVVVEAGDRLAIDGSVISGQASINQATLTGESEPVVKKIGDQVFSSTLNESGSLLVRVEKIGEDTTLAKIITLISQAASGKSATLGIADKFTTWYIWSTLIASVVIYAFSRDLSLVLAVLLVVCADDVAVAVPLTFTATIARAAKRGILMKGASVIENITKIKVFVTDKTGTLTWGKPKVVGVHVFGGALSEADLLAFFGAAEVSSGHPAGRAIVSYVQSRNIAIQAPEEMHETPGEGVAATVKGKKILAGKIGFLQSQGVLITDPDQEMIDATKFRGESITALALEGKLAGMIMLEDEVRPFAKTLIEKTKALGVGRWIMLTGDNEIVADRVAHQLGIDEARANMTPQTKLDLIKDFKQTYGTLAMIGDGVNDAAALALADVSFAMGAIGSDAAIEASDIALMNDRLNRIPESMHIARASLKIVRRSFWIWGITNAVGLLLVFGGVLGPQGAAAYNFLTDFIPIINALLILRVKINS